MIAPIPVSTMKVVADMAQITVGGIDRRYLIFITIVTTTIEEHGRGEMIRETTLVRVMNRGKFDTVVMATPKISDLQ